MFENLTDRQLLEQMNQRLIRIERRQKAISIRNWVITGLVVIALIVLTVFLVPKIRFLVEQYHIIAENIQNISDFIKSLDAEQIKQAFTRLGEINAAKMNELLSKLSDIDFHAMLDQMKKLLEPLSNLASFFGFNK